MTDTNNYYPFGLNHIGGSAASKFGSYYSYKFGNKELQETGMHDFGARMYMADLGRWGVMDAMSEKYNKLSPYNYALNNPMLFVDPDGNNAITYTGAAAVNAFIGIRDSMSSSQNDFFAPSKFPEFGSELGFGLGKNTLFGNIDFSQFGLDDLGDIDCPKCPKKAKDGEMYSIGFTGYQFRDGNWVELEPGKSITYKGKSYFNPSVEPITGDVPIGPASLFKVTQLHGFYIRARTLFSNGTFEKTVQGLASLKEGTSLIKLIKSFEAEALGVGAKQIVIRGIDIVENRLIQDVGFAKRMGYTVEKTSNNSIKIYKKL